MDINVLKDQKKRKVITEEFYISRIVGFALHHVEKNCKMNILEIEIGSYGGLIVGRKKESSVRLAVEIVIAEKCPSQFIEVWPRLQHPNVHRILEREYIERIDSYMFVTEHPSESLESLFLKERGLLSDQNALGNAKRILWDILEGIEYIHALKYCHLQLKSKNILITSNNRTVISNFTLMEKLDKVPKNIPLNYGPPEMHLASRSSSFSGDAYDIWSIGILAFNIFTKRYLQIKLPENANWDCRVFPTFLDFLQEKKFFKCVQHAFPMVDVSEEVKRCMRNFVISCLRILPEDRPSASYLRHHSYLIPGAGHFTNDIQPWDHESIARRNAETPGWFRNIFSFFEDL